MSLNHFRRSLTWEFASYESLKLRTKPGQQKVGRRSLWASLECGGVVERTALVLAWCRFWCGSARRTVCEV